MLRNSRTLIILNPVAGKGRAGERVGEVRDVLASRNIDFELRLTERVGHAVLLAEAASREGFGVVVAAGGDGTANEVVNGLMAVSDADRPAFGALCVGRGNDFAYGADVPSDLAEAADVIALGETRLMDVGRVAGGDFPDGKYFCNGIGIGFDTIVGLEAAKLRYVHGFMAYVIGALKTFIMFPTPPFVRLVHDGGVIEQKTNQISIMNGRRMGGTFFMAPHADNGDGLLDLCMTTAMTRRQMISLMGKYVKGTQAEASYVTTGRSRSFDILAEAGGLIVHADGETICTDGTHLAIECFPSRIRMLCRKREQP